VDRQIVPWWAFQGLLLLLTGWVFQFNSKKAVRRKTIDECTKLPVECQKKLDEGQCSGIQAG
jgi:hypothetical protein